MTKPLTVVFAGTPAFTTPCLDAIAESEHKLLAVYTQPDRPAGRGRSLQASAVKTWALARQLPIYQPINFKDPETVTELARLQPDILVVIAYGLILPRTVLTLPRLGCINVHASLLPRWRGASPIQQAILHGDERTGITIMQMDAGMDTGALLTQVPCPIQPEDTTASLHDRLAKLATTPLLKTLNGLASCTITSTNQDNNLATHAPKIQKEDALINWNTAAVEINQQIRAFNPWPIAYTHASDLVLRIYQARVLTNETALAPGTVLSIDKHGMQVSTGRGILLVEQVQFPGARAMSIADWLHAGRRQLHVGLVLQ